jgi:hypothetical protein
MIMHVENESFETQLISSILVCVDNGRELSFLLGDNKLRNSNRKELGLSHGEHMEGQILH